jgi:FkbM family methyltransferase
MPAGKTVSEGAANLLARAALRVPALERLLVAGARNSMLRKHLRLGAIALGYPRILKKRVLRVAEMPGYRFYVNVGESLGVGPYFFGDPGTAWLTRSLLRSGDICVDAGANAGHYTFLAASVVGPEGRVFAFEPNPDFATLIRRSIALNGFEGVVEVCGEALWSSSGERKRFYISVEPTNSGTSSLVDHGWFLSESNTIEVQTLRFDDFAVRSKIASFRLVKVDVERAEAELLEGAKGTLRSHRIDHLIIEMYEGSRAHQLLTNAGYEGFLLDSQQRQVRPLSSVSPGCFGDYIFTRPGLELPQQ